MVVQETEHLSARSDVRSVKIDEDNIDGERITYYGGIGCGGTMTLNDPRAAIFSALILVII